MQAVQVVQRFGFEKPNEKFQHVYFGSCPHCLLVNSSSQIFVGSLVPGTPMFSTLGEKIVSNHVCRTMILWERQIKPIKKHVSFANKTHFTANAVKNDLMFGA